MKTRLDLFEYLAHLGISTTTVEHEPLFTVEQADKLASDIPGGHIKNLFLKDDKKQLWLIVAEDHAKIELKKVGTALNTKGLRFADAQLLWQTLGVKPGSVTPFALINDPDHKVKVIIDKTLLDCDIINAHPLENTATTSIAVADFKKFLEAIGNAIQIIDLSKNALIKY
jgi:Ala-tRNA(Pro) deacylase